VSTEERIKNLIESPKSVTGDGVTVVEQTISDIIEADRYLAKKKAAGQGLKRLLRFIRYSPPGAV
jgi:hypothetical protein